MKVLVVTGTRADFGLWRPVLEALQATPGIDVELLVMAMHLDVRFGGTIEEVRATGFPIAAEVPCTPTGDGPAEMAASLGVAIEGAAAALESIGPDWLLVLGDRGEQLAAALCALHLGLAVAHLHGGERTLGSVDDVVRDLITRTAHLHLVATASATDRLMALGEEAWRIHRTGAPGLDAIVHAKAPDDGTLRARYRLPPDGPYLLALIHPETGSNPTPASALADALIGGIAAHRIPTVGIWPNADAGGRSIAARLEAHRERFTTLRPSIPHDDFVVLLRGAAAIVGNSSSGIIEAPLLRIPAVNIGRRQEGRERGDNVIDVGADAAEVRSAIGTALSGGFRSRLSGRSPYGDGHAAGRIAEAIRSTPRDRRLFQKVHE
jgi:GDP/UDP-N,N'-diacetylbacillosamine 2-epimerase (hydrolysing)